MFWTFYLPSRVLFFETTQTPGPVDTIRQGSKVTLKLETLFTGENKDYCPGQRRWPLRLSRSSRATGNFVLHACKMTMYTKIYCQAMVQENGANGHQSRTVVIQKFLDQIDVCENHSAAAISLQAQLVQRFPGQKIKFSH
jgi:hypothetical protein